MRELYIIGAGGFGREVAWLVERINESGQQWDLRGFVDDDESTWGTTVGSYPVLGGCDILDSVERETWAVCAVGSARVREKIVEKVSAFSNVSFATLVDPSVLMSSRVTMGEGCIVCAGTILTVDIKLGCHVILNLDCTVGHDAVLDDFVTAYPSVNVSGATQIGRCVELGTGMQIIQGKAIGEGTVVGAGAVVVRDIPPRCVAVGSPAKPIKQLG